MEDLTGFVGIYNDEGKKVFIEDTALCGMMRPEEWVAATQRKNEEA